MGSGIISVLITLVLIGVILYVVETFIPMDGRIKQLIRIVAIILVLLWLLRVFLGVGPATL